MGPKLFSILFKIIFTIFFIIISQVILSCNSQSSHLLNVHHRNKHIQQYRQSHDWQRGVDDGYDDDNVDNDIDIDIDIDDDDDDDDDDDGDDDNDDSLDDDDLGDDNDDDDDAFDDIRIEQPTKGEEHKHHSKMVNDNESQNIIDQPDPRPAFVGIKNDMESSSNEIYNSHYTNDILRRHRYKSRDDDGNSGSSSINHRLTMPHQVPKSSKNNNNNNNNNKNKNNNNNKMNDDSQPRHRNRLPIVVSISDNSFVSASPAALIRSPNNELPFEHEDNSVKFKYWRGHPTLSSHKASINIAQEQEPDELHRGGLNSTLIAILFGIGATGMLILIVGHKMRSIRERVAYRGRRRSLVPDTDFLVNTIPI